ncbi:MAG TPA: DUF1634 domain-containing protein [Terriglobales bacterium]|nr:DUF1634 domain-containing protein [Terriglobales bacterium]
MPSSAAPAPQPHPQQPQPQRWDDRRIEVILGNLLRSGVLLPAAVVLSGACVYLSRHAHEPADYRIFRGEPSEFRTIAGVIHSVLNGRGRGLIQLGLLLLIATPIARVAFSIVGFAIERDRMYVAFTLIVLAILLYSLLGSGLGV